MRKVFWFYIQCCLGILLYNYTWINISYGNFETKDAIMGFQVSLLVTLLLYAPVCTIIAYVYEKLKITKAILRFPILYSLFPYVTSDILQKGNISFDNIFYYVFLIENLIIVLYFVVQNINKNS